MAGPKEQKGPARDHKGKTDELKMHVGTYDYVEDAYVKVKGQECK
jgi:hypothetical protein